MKIKLSIIAIALLLFLPVATAQVTIGSHEPPRDGSLLDLNENGNKGKNANANKGLGLPRVALTSLTTLTIDDELVKDDYVGIMVYNTTNNSNIKEGTYCWTGSTWKQAIVVNDKGADGSMLKSNGDGTYSWSNVTIPEFKYHKPTNIIGFKKNNAQENTYRYRQIVATPIGGSYRYAPEPGLFNGKYVYIDTLDIQTDASIAKYMLLGTTIYTKKATIDNRVPIKSTWEFVQIEISINLLGDTSETVLGKHQNVMNISKDGTGTTFSHYFTIIPLIPGGFPLEKEKYEVKVKVINLQNTFKYNTVEADPPAGNFDIQASVFYTAGIEDFNCVIFEYE